MSARDALGLSVAPIFLRLAIGLTFLWAGLGKVFDKVMVAPASVTYLESLGVKADPPAAPAPEALKPAEAIPTLTPVLPPKKTAEDATALPRMYSLALLINQASAPAKHADGSHAMALWPQWAAAGRWPVYLARTVAVAEIAAGLFVLAGLLTRLSALSLAGVMLGAIWLTEIGPAIQSGATIFGFIPDRPAYSIEAWRGLAWQFSLLMACLTLVLLGGGTLSFDRAMFPRAAPRPKGFGPSGNPRPAI